MASSRWDESAGPPDDALLDASTPGMVAISQGSYAVTPEVAAPVAMPGTEDAPPVGPDALLSDGKVGADGLPGAVSECRYRMTAGRRGLTR